MALIQKEAETILNTVLTASEEHNKCPRCKNPFGEPLEDGGVRRVMSACAFQKGARVSEARRRSCVVCHVCVNEDGDGTGHIWGGNKAGKCWVCVEALGLAPKEACFATLPATEIPNMTATFATLYEGKRDNEKRLEHVEEQQQSICAEEQRENAAAAQDRAAQRRGFADRSAELVAREAEIDAARTSSDFAGSTWDEYKAWKALASSSQDEEEAASRTTERDAARAKKMASLEEDKRLAEAALTEERARNKQELRAAKDAAESEVRKAVADVARIAAEQQTVAVRQAVDAVATAAAVPLVEVVCAQEEEEEKKKATTADRKRKVRSDEEREQSNAKRANTAEEMRNLVDRLTDCCGTLGFRAPKGMFRIRKGDEEGDYRTNGSVNKDTLWAGLNEFLERSNTKCRHVLDALDGEKAKNSALVRHLRAYVEKTFRTELVDTIEDAEIGAAVDAKMASLLAEEHL
jgi:hypothetical protein